MIGSTGCDCIKTTQRSTIVNERKGASHKCDSRQNDPNPVPAIWIQKQCYCSFKLQVGYTLLYKEAYYRDTEIITMELVKQGPS